MWLKVVALVPWKRADIECAMTCLSAQSKDKSVSAKRARQTANEWRFSGFLPKLFRTTSATCREKQISICAIFFELSFVRYRNYRTPTFAHGDLFPR
jgi:hypothetical protein